MKITCTYCRWFGLTCRRCRTGAAAGTAERPPFAHRRPPPESLPVPNQWPEPGGRAGNVAAARYRARHVRVAAEHLRLGYRKQSCPRLEERTGFRNGQPADLVLGQPDFVHTGPRARQHVFRRLQFARRTRRGTGGNLYVADTRQQPHSPFSKALRAAERPVARSLYRAAEPQFQGSELHGRSQRSGTEPLERRSWPTNNMAFDSDQNLWVVDGGNRRVLRFANSDLAAGGGPLAGQPSVLGQLDFNSVQPNVTNATRTTTNAFALPVASRSTPPVVSTSPTGCPTGVSAASWYSPAVHERAIGRAPDGSISDHRAVSRCDRQDHHDRAHRHLFPGGKIGVVDSFSHRILLFDTFDKWPDQSAQFSPLATAVFGQPDFHNRALKATLNTWVLRRPRPRCPARSRPWLRAPSCSSPTREITGWWSCRSRAATLASATRVLGQDNFTMRRHNLVEGREFAFLQPGERQSHRGRRRCRHR